MRGFPSKTQAFTLLELLIVIAILAILATAVVLILKPDVYLNDARVASTRSTLNEIITAFNSIKGFTGKSLQEVTGNYWTAGACQGTTTPAWDNQACLTAWQNALSLVEAEGAQLGITGSLGKFLVDDWGSPFGLDENEGETWGGGTCRRDDIYSYGPDGLFGGGDDIYPHEIFGWSTSGRYIINVTLGCTGLYD